MAIQALGAHHQPTFFFFSSFLIGYWLLLAPVKLFEFCPSAVIQLCDSAIYAFCLILLGFQADRKSRMEFPAYSRPLLSGP